MVVRVLNGKRVAPAVRYNEEKLGTGAATQLLADGFPHARLAFGNRAYKTDVLEALAARNPAVGRPCLHASLSFHPREVLTDARMAAIGREFADRLGYGSQPLLLYRHHDTAHPHVHLVSVSVGADGKRISDSFLHRRVSRIRRELEREHGLVVAGRARGTSATAERISALQPAPPGAPPADPLRRFNDLVRRHGKARVARALRRLARRATPPKADNVQSTDPAPHHRPAPRRGRRL